MKFQPVKGTRDFHPDAMRLRNWITDTWRRVSLRNGFEEYDAPIFEYLDLFTIKSGQEIAGQLFSFTDRGGRNLAIRPEITPSLARMINARINALPRPIKWFSIPRLCRAEKPQRGRLREFFQWNIDIIGPQGALDAPLADAESILVAVDFLHAVGLGPKDVCVRIGSRPLVLSTLRGIGVPDASMEGALLALDKRLRASDAQFYGLAHDAGMTEEQIKTIMVLEECESPTDIRSFFVNLEALRRVGVPMECAGTLSRLLKQRDAAGKQELGRLALAAGLPPEKLDRVLDFSQRYYEDDTLFADINQRWGFEGSLADMLTLWNNLEAFPVGGHRLLDYCLLDMRIVRGLAYYTGIVYEIYDRSESLRAVAGGGRYDNLLEVLGGPKIGATGFGMGDVVLGILLEEKGKVPAEVQAPTLDFFVIDGQKGMFKEVIEMVGTLRSKKGFSADFSFKRQAIGKQLKEANRRGANCALILRRARCGVTLDIKHMARGDQIPAVDKERFLGEIVASLGGRGVSPHEASVSDMIFERWSDS